MERNQLFAILGLMLALGLPMPILLFADPSKIGTEEELLQALADPSLPELTLMNDIVLMNNLEFNRDVRLDLGGFKIVSLKHNARVIDVKSGQVTLAGQGSIVANGDGAAAVRVKGATTPDNAHYASITIEPGVTLYAPNYYGLFVTPSFKAAYGVTVDLGGAIVARDGICINGNIQGSGANIPQIIIRDGAKITVDEHEGIALYASGHGNWQIAASQILAATPLYARSGLFTFTKTQMTATASSDKHDSEDFGLGAVFCLVHEPSVMLPLKLTIDSGEYISQQEYTFVRQSFDTAPSQYATDCTIKSGHFVGRLGNFFGFNVDKTSPYKLTINGGDFNCDIGQHLNDDQQLDRDPVTHDYHVIAKATVAARATDQQLAASTSNLKGMLKQAHFYLSPEYAGDELGELQPAVDRALQTLRRATKAAEPLAEQHGNTSHYQATIRKFQSALTAVQDLEDELRTEIYSIIATARAIDPRDYSRYSYEILIQSVDQTEQILENSDTTLKELYSAYCDIDLNLELLDDPEEESDRLGGLLPALAAPLPPAEPEIEEEDEAEKLFFAMLLGSFAVANTDLPAEEPIAQPTVPDLPIPQEPSLSVVPQPPAMPDPKLAEARQALRNLLNGVSVLNPADYTSESYAGLAQAVTAAGNLLANDSASATFDMLATAFNRVNFAYESLMKKPSDPTLLARATASENLRSVLSVVQNLSLSDYEAGSVEQFGELQVAIARAQAILTRHASLSEILAIMDEITAATAGLKGIQPTEPATSMADDTPVAVAQPAETQQYYEPATSPERVVDWTPLREVVADITKLHEADYTPTSYQKLLQRLEQARNLLANANATQDQIEDVVFELNLAILDLDYVGTIVDDDQAAVTLSTADVDTMMPHATIAEAAPNVAPNLLMSMMAGAYAGIATYRKSRMEAKRRKHLRSLVS